MINNRHSACTDNVCMRSITVAQVFMQVRSLYEARAGRLRLSA